MSNPLYASLQLRAVTLLRKFGQPWTLTTTDEAGGQTDRIANGVYLSDVRHLLGESGIEIGDKKYIFEASASPLMSDRFAANGEDWVICHVEPIKPANVVLAWYVWGRAG